MAKYISRSTGSRAENDAEYQHMANVIKELYTSNREFDQEKMDAIFDELQADDHFDCVVTGVMTLVKSMDDRLAEPNADRDYEITLTKAMVAHVIKHKDKNCEI